MDIRRIASSPLPPPLFERLQRMVVDASGLWIDADRPGRLVSAVEDRMAALHLSSPEAYCDRLADPNAGRAELTSLVERLTVGETYFFRNPAQFEILTERVLPAYAARQGDRAKTLTIWSAGCCTGEEPYSLAITLLERLPELASWQVSILGTDLNHEFLRRAEEGVYNARTLRHVPPAWREKYFTERGAKYALRDDVKRLVRFEPLNLAVDPFTRPGLQPVDVIWCRNVTIYFPLEVTRRIIDRFADVLAGDGWLFLGEAETLWQISTRFAPVEFPHAVVYRPAGPVTTARPDRLAEPAHEPPAPFIPVPSLELLEPRPASRAAAPAAAPSRPLQQAIRTASALADDARYDEAIGSLQAVVRLDNLSSEAYYLLGVLYQRTGRWDQAAEAFQRALYVEPALALASYGLGNLYRFQGRPAKARREFRNTLLALNGKPDDELIRLSDEITCGALRRACQRQLEGAAT